MSQFISLCIIAKDEEKVIGRCLDSVYGVVDEIIVVDTGSSDNTKTIAREFTDHIYDFEWINDFSAARNFAASMAKSKWILVLDADEYVDRDDLKNTISDIKSHQDKFNTYAATTISFLGDAGETTVQNRNFRVYRNDGNFEFYRAIHEQVRSKKGTEQVVALLNLKIYHSGYIAKTMAEKKKSERNLPLVRQEMKCSDQAFDLYNYGVEMSIKGNTEEALHAFVKAYQNKESVDYEWVPYCLLCIVQSLIQLDRFVEAMDIIRDAEELYPNYPDFTYCKGVVYLSEKRFEDAKKTFLYIFENSSGYTGAIKSPDYLEYLPCKILGSLYAQEKEFDKAVTHFVTALNTNKYCLESMISLINILKDHHEEEEIYRLLSEKILTTLNREFLLKVIGIVLNQRLMTLAKLLVGKHFPNDEVVEQLVLLKTLVVKKVSPDEEIDSAKLLYGLKNSLLDWADLFLLFTRLEETPTRASIEFILMNSVVSDFVSAFLRNDALGMQELQDSYLFLLEKSLLFQEVETAQKLLALQTGMTQDINAKIANTLYRNGYEDEAIPYYELSEEASLTADDYDHIVSWLIAKDNAVDALRISRDAINRYSNDFRFYKHAIVIGEDCGTPQEEVIAAGRAVFKNCEWLSSGRSASGAMTPEEQCECFEEAERLIQAKQDEEASRLYERLTQSEDLAALAYFRLGEIANRSKDILLSEQYHLLAFRKDPSLARRLVKPDHPSHNYVYQSTIDNVQDQCPLCGDQGIPHSCYNVISNIDYVHGFNPVRLWMHCEQCHHLFANKYPNDIGGLLTETTFDFLLDTNTRYFPMISDIISRISHVAPGNRLLEIGVGAGELSAVAKEHLFDVTGIDIRPIYAENVSKMLNIPVHAVDFQEYKADELFDVICMGDVIEHMLDPVSAIRKSYLLLNNNGVLWISTPNFESAFSMVNKDTDPMWRVTEHMNYFSFTSLRKILNELGFKVIDYRVSSHYAGSMELIAKKVT
ncbi:methyltransferase domain-containing protein [Paenibacillus sp. TRM 82003]|nr:methyltransferase domain-containing protein [Paenibacillus sp. TRM 82003]MCI3923385.1 methyltransferase domain-containing protein [Paenibacillus sp. TRM 82003]